MSPIRLSPSVLHILTEYLSPLGCREPWLHYSSPRRAAMVRPTSPLLPARRPYAKVPELGSWALAGVTGRAIGDAPKTRAALGQRGHNATYHAGMLQCTLFPTLPRDVLTRPAFDLETPHNLYAEGTVRNA